MKTNKKHSKHQKKIMLLCACLAVVVVLLATGYCYRFYYGNNTLNQKCIASAEDAETQIKQLPEVRDFIKSFDKKAGQIEIKATLDYYIDDNPDSGIVMVGTSLLNGGFKKFNSYRFRFSCGLDFRKEEKTEGQEFLKFTYRTGDKEETFTDESMYCLDYATPEAMYFDFNKDNINEVLIQCYAGSGSAKEGYYHIGGSDIFVYSIKENGLSEIVDLWNERGFEWKVQDFNNDDYLDIRVGEYFDCESGEKNKLCQEGGSWAIIPKTYIWDKQKNEFVETKTVGE